MRFALFLIPAVLAVFLVACGGGSKSSSGASSSGSSSGGPLSQSDAQKLTNTFFVNFFGALSGNKKPEDFIALFTKECRDKTKASDITSAAALITLFAPELAKAKIDDFDIGEMNITNDKDGAKIFPKDTKKSRVHLNGKWVSFDDFGKELGMTDSSDSPLSTDTADEPLTVARENGKWLISDCSVVSDFGDSGSGPDITEPTPRSGSSTAPAGTPQAGSSRTQPIALGQAGVVDKVWQITVRQVNKDAWTVIRAYDKFADPPASNERMVLIGLSVKNVAAKGDKAENVDDFSFRLTGSQNTLYSAYDGKHDCGSIPEEIDADLFPGGEAKGNVCFKVPADETGLLLVWRSLNGASIFFNLQ